MIQRPLECSTCCERLEVPYTKLEAKQFYGIHSFGYVYADTDSLRQSEK